MKRLLILALAALLLRPALAAERIDPARADPAQVNPAADVAAMTAYFQKKFPHVPPADFVNGPYAMDAGMRAQWQQIMQFPPYQFALDHGKDLFATAFPNGRHYADCLPRGGIGIAAAYPRFDAKTGRVVTLEIAVNRCRVANGLAKLKLTTGDMADLMAYLTDRSRGQPIAVVVPDDPRALAAYQRGKAYFYSRRGQLNFSCASCHVQGAGQHLRGDVLAPARGLIAAFPIYRSDWGSMGTVVRRFIGCNEQVRVVPERPDSADYRDLEYFLAYMNNGLPVAGPGTRP
ncbi:MAG: sulfur oxidation c-type cytochrome SoxA [Proteobacteria bacterium]|nr:sulfur oxidation c-type cytochrome SoxA [Pseudomonadota bacterium]